MASYDSDGGGNTRRYSGIKDIGGQRINSTPTSTEGSHHRESAATAALRNVQREMDRAASPRRESNVNKTHQRESFDRIRKTPQPAGYYIPPPGYADPLRDNLEDDYKHSCPEESESELLKNKRWSGPCDDTRCWSINPHQPRHRNGNDWYTPRPHYSFERPGKKGMPSLSHQDWSVPQAKQILSHWATLATLLGGVQATLLAYYSKQEQIGEGARNDKVYKMVIAISCSALFLEIYGALLAAGTIVASISLQARNIQSTKQQHPQQTDCETLLKNGMFSLNAINANPPPSSAPPLSPRASAILDRLTVLVGFIIPLGAVLELIGLAGYTAHYLGNSVAITMGLTLVVAILATICAGFLGVQAGNRAF